MKDLNLYAVLAVNLVQDMSADGVTLLTTVPVSANVMIMDVIDVFVPQWLTWRWTEGGGVWWQRKIL